MQRRLETHLVWDDWLWLLHVDWLVEQGALVQGELGMRVQRWADLERSRGRGTHAGWQHLRLAEGLSQTVTGRPSVALEVWEREGARWAQVWRGGLGGHAVQWLLRRKQVGGLASLLGTFWFRVVVCLWIKIRCYIFLKKTLSIILVPYLWRNFHNNKTINPEMSLKYIIIFFVKYTGERLPSASAKWSSKWSIFNQWKIDPVGGSNAI